MNPATVKTLVRLGAGLVFFVLLIWMMSALESVTTTLLISFFMAYSLNPLVSAMERLGLGRSTASLLALCVVFAFCAGIVLLVAPAIFSELSEFSRRAPRYFLKLKEVSLNLLESFEFQIPQDWNEFLLMAYDKIGQSLPKVTSLASTIMSTVFSSTLSILSVFFQMVLIPIIAYYLMVSFNSIINGAVDLIPPYTRNPIVNKFREIDSVIAAFVRGQITIALIMAILYSIGFIIIGIELSLVLGVLAGLLQVVPYLGALVAIVGGSIMAFVKFGDVLHVMYVLGWIGIVQTFESYFLTPRIVGQAVGLNPVVYILVLVVGANLFGFVGLLVAIPVAAVARVLLTSAIEAYRKSYLYSDTEPGQKP
ncbi:MAG: AI-2E family transporter [Pseudomonadota bacterium]